MSTLSGIVSKGEKGKTKYQSIDINSLYRTSRGESLEQQQQKSTVPRKHGMQTLGKVPSARRPPANLPSLRSETSSSDPAVALVPSGGSGWATTKESAPTTNTVTSTNTPTNTTHVNSTPTQCATGPIPAKTPSLTQQQHPSLPGQNQHQTDSGKSSWSAIMSKQGDVGGGPVAGQQQTQQNRESAQYGPGPSLRPQTEGSWSQGGSRIAGGAPGSAGAAGAGNTQGGPGPHLGGPSPAEAAAGVRTNSAQSQGMAGGQAGQNAAAGGASQNNQANQHQAGMSSMHHYRGIIPPFMYKGAGNNFPTQFPASGPRPRFNYTGDRASPRQQERESRQAPPEEEIVTRPIIKEEDLSRMDDISRDAGWTASDDIDYNQKLAFSDEEGDEPSSNQHSQSHQQSSSSAANSKKIEDSRKESDHKKDHSEEKDNLPSREKEHQPQSKDNRNDIQSMRSWNQQGPPRDYRGQTAAPSNNYPPQQPSRSSHPIRDEEELWNQRRREQAENVNSVVIRARQRKEEEEKRFLEQTRQAAAKKLQDLENKLREKQQKDEEQQKQQAGNSESKSSVPPAASAIMPEWKRETRSRTSSSDASSSKDSQQQAGAPDKHQATSEFRQIERPSFMRQQQQQQSAGASNASSSMEPSSGPSAREPAFSRHFQSNLPPRFQKQQAERNGAAAAQAQTNNRLSPSTERSSQPVSFSRQCDPGRWVHNHANSLNNSMKPGPRRMDDRDRDRERDRDDDARDRRSSGGSSSHRRFEPARKQSSNEYYDDYPRRDRDRYSSGKEYDYDDNRRNSGSWADQHPDRERRSYDEKDNRDHRDRKDHDGYSKGSPQEHAFDDQPPSDLRHSVRSDNNSSIDWHDSRVSHEDRRSVSSADLGHRSENERPTRPDSRDSRTSRTSVHEDSRIAPSTGSWANDYPEYEEEQLSKQQVPKKPLGDNFREDIRDRDRDRRQMSGPLMAKDKHDQDQDVHNKRGGPMKRHDDKKDSSKELVGQDKKEECAWGRKSETKSTSWADAMSPTFEKEEEEKHRYGHDDKSKMSDHKQMNELKHGMEKLGLDNKKRSGDASSADMLDKDVDDKDDKRDKNARNRAGSGSARGPRPSDSRNARQWPGDRDRDRDRVDRDRAGSNACPSAGGRDRDRDRGERDRPWRNESNVQPAASAAPSSRGGRRGPGGGRGLNRKSGCDRTDSELSGDELGQASHDQLPKARSPKPSAPKAEKDERNRNQSSSTSVASSASASTAASSQQQQQKSGSNKDISNDSQQRDFGPRGGDKGSDSGGPSREGFAPSGEPSRRGRGGFRTNNTSRGAPPVNVITTGGATGGRMDVYGPPPSKSPFSTDGPDNLVDSNKTNVGQSEHYDQSNAQLSGDQSADEKTMAKQQALTAGITRHAKSPSTQVNNHSGGNNAGQQQNTGPRPPKEKELKSKRNRSGSRRGGGRGRGMSMKNEHGNEEWETNSENSEEQPLDGHGPSSIRPNKPFGNERAQQHNAVSNNRDAHDNRDNRDNRRGGGNRDRDREPREQQPKGGDNKGPKSSNAQSNRAPGAEKARNAQGTADRSGGQQRNHIPPLTQNTQMLNGRPRSQGSANAGPINSIKMGKDAQMVNRVDDIKLNDPNLVNQALNDINAKKSKEKRSSAGSNVDHDDGSIIDDAASGNAQDDGKIDSDGFQEVRSKKNVKDSSRQQQKDDQQNAKAGGGRRERSKSKSNGSQSSRGGDGMQQQQQQPQQSQSQNQSIPPLMGPPGAAGQAKQHYGQHKQKLAPRFQKQKMAKQQAVNESVDIPSSAKPGSKDGSAVTPAPPPVNAWDKPFTSGSAAKPPSPAVGSAAGDIQLMSVLTPGSGSNSNAPNADHDSNQAADNQRNSPNCDKIKLGSMKDQTGGQDDTTSAPVQTLIFENTNYSKNTKSNVGSTGDMAIKSKYSSHMKPQQRQDSGNKRSNDVMEDNEGVNQLQQQQSLAVAFSTKSCGELGVGKDKLVQQQEAIQMPLTFGTTSGSGKEDTADMKLDFTFDSDLGRLADDKGKSLGMPRSIQMPINQSTISPSTAELNLKIASVKKVWGNAPPVPTVVERDVVDPSSVVSAANSFNQPFGANGVDDGYGAARRRCNQAAMKNDMNAANNVCKLVPQQVKPQQQSSGGRGAQPGSAVPGPSPMRPGRSPIGHPPASLRGPLSPPPYNSTGQPSHINYQQYPGSQAAAPYGNMSAIPSPPAVLFNTGSGQLPAQAGNLYGAFQLDQGRSPFTQYPPYAPSLQSSYNQNMYMQPQQPPPPPPQPPTAQPDLYQSNLSQQYRLAAAAAPPFGQNQQLSNNPNTVLISSSSNSLMSASVKPSTQPIGAIGTKTGHFPAPSAPQQPNQLAYIPYDPQQVLGVSGNYMGNSQLVQRPGPNVQPPANNYYNAASAGKPNPNLYVFSGSQTGYFQQANAAQQTGAHCGLQGFGQHNQNLATGNAAPVGLQNFGSQFLSNSGLQIAAAAAQQYAQRNPPGGLPGPANAAANFLSKHQQQEQPRQLKSPSGNQQDVLGSVFNSSLYSSPQIPSPKSRKQQASSQQQQSSSSQHHKYNQYQNINQPGLVGNYNNQFFMQQNRGMQMPPRGNIQPNQQRYPAPIQRPVVPSFPPGGPNNSQQGQQQNCMPNQQQQQSQMNRHRPNMHQQQQQRNMKMQQQQYYSNQSNVKMDSGDKDPHSDKISDVNAGNSSVGGNKGNVNPVESDNKEEVGQQNE